MQYRTIGSSGIEGSVVALGAWAIGGGPWWGPTDDEESIRAIHAGLECGLIGGTYPHLDMISFGPTIRSPHSPDEKVNIASVGKFYTWLLEALENVPKK